MRCTLPLSIALLAMPMLAAAQQPPAQPAPTIRTISEDHPLPANAMPAYQRPPLDPTAFCYFADRAYSLGAHMTDMVCVESNPGMMTMVDGHKVPKRLEWKKSAW